MKQITLKGARVSAGYTLREVGSKINRSFQTIAKYEKDSTKIPVDLLRELTSLYNISPDLIFLGKSTKKKRTCLERSKPMELVYMDGKKEPYTTSAIIAECAGIKHHAIQEHIRKQIGRLEQFGKVSFKMRPLQSGQQAKDYILNEQQATLLITFLKNTEQVANFKTNLVKAFFEMRDELSKFRMQRALEKPKRKTLHDSIENWEQAPKHAHSTMNNLLLKAVTDRNAKQLREERGGYNGIDSLTSDELEQYQAFEDMVIAMIGLNMSYQEIKAMAFRNKKTRQRSA